MRYPLDALPATYPSLVHIQSTSLSYTPCKQTSLSHLPCVFLSLFSLASIHFRLTYKPIPLSFLELYANHCRPHPPFRHFGHSINHLILMPTVTSCPFAVSIIHGVWIQDLPNKPTILSSFSFRPHHLHPSLPIIRRSHIVQSFHFSFTDNIYDTDYEKEKKSKMQMTNKTIGFPPPPFLVH